MLNPQRLCNDLFADRELFDGNLRPFTEDFLLRTALPINNPGGIYNTLLSDTTAKYTNYFGKMTNEMTKKAISEGFTINMNNARSAVEGKLSQLQGLIKFKFGEEAGVYQDFYPLGMDEYYQAKVGVLYPLLLRFVNAAAANLNTDYPLEVTAVTSLVSSFQTARSAQEAIFGEIEAIGSGKEEDRKLLTVQLTTNFLTIALNNIDKPHRFDDYYDPRYLPISRDADEQEPVVKEGTVNGGATQNIDLTGINGNPDNITIKLFNPGTGTLRYYFTNISGGGPQTTFTDVNAGEDIEKTATELGVSDTATFFTVQNLVGMPSGYKVAIYV